MRGPCIRGLGRRGFICTLRDSVGEEVVVMMDQWDEIFFSFSFIGFGCMNGIGGFRR